jgi:hypothetical protein
VTTAAAGLTPPWSKKVLMPACGGHIRTLRAAAAGVAVMHKNRRAHLEIPVGGFEEASRGGLVGSRYALKGLERFPVVHLLPRLLVVLLSAPKFLFA